MTKVFLLSVFFVILLVSLSFACEGEFKGTAKVEMRGDNSLCITVTPKGKPTISKCFEEGTGQYNEIKERFKAIKPGDVREIRTINC